MVGFSFPVVVAPEFALADEASTTRKPAQISDEQPRYLKLADDH
jgi:hypothetical protein